MWWMIEITRVTLAAVLSGFLLLQGTAMGNPIDTWAWNYRPLILFAPTENDARLAEQRAHFLELEDSLRERDVAFVELIGEKVIPRFRDTLELFLPQPER